MQNNRIGSYRVPKNTLCSHWCNSQNIWSIWRRTPCFTRSLSGIERFQPIFAVQSIAICCLRARHTIIYLARLNRLPDFVSRHALLQSSSVHKLYAYIKFDWSNNTHLRTVWNVISERTEIRHMYVQGRYSWSPNQTGVVLQLDQICNCCLGY